MSNELPQAPTQMCEPVIRGEMVASDVYDFYINNKLNKAIDEYWQRKYKTFAKGRIKRMCKRRKNRYVRLDKRVGKRAYSFNSDFCSNLTRWNRH